MAPALSSARRYRRHCLSKVLAASRGTSSGSTAAEERHSGSRLGDRVDRGHVESRDGVHEGQPWVQELLRRADGEAAAGHGAAELPQWVPAEPPSPHARSPGALAKVKDDLRELDE